VGRARGARVRDGRIHFKPDFIQDREFLKQDSTFFYFDLNETWQQLDLQSGSMAFTYLGVPIIYKKAEKKFLIIIKADGSEEHLEEPMIPKLRSGEMFNRTSGIERIEVGIVL
jgi:hypothetical protein